MHAPTIVRGALAALCLIALPALACRPFGSYQFVEDRAGGVWFTEGDNNAISRLAPDGSVRSHPLPTPDAEPSSLALDRKGNVWFVESEGGKVGRLDTQGRVVEYPVADGHPVLVAVDARDEAWFTQMSGHENDGEHAGHGGPAQVGRIDRGGAMHSYPLPEGWPTSIAFDRQDRAWVSILVPGGKEGRPQGRLARLARDGQWTIAASWENSCPGNLVRHPAGGLLFSDHCRGVLGRVDTKGGIVEIRLPEGTYIQQMTVAGDGTVWFSGDPRGRLGKISPDGRLAYVERPDNGDEVMAVHMARNGDLLFSEFYNYNINRLTRKGEYVEHLVNVEERTSARQVRDGEVCYVQFAARIAAKSDMDRRRAEEVKLGRFKPDGHGTETLAEQKCLACHDARRLLLSRRSDWTPSIRRMQGYIKVRDHAPLSEGEIALLVRYFNENYGLR